MAKSYPIKKSLEWKGHTVRCSHCQNDEFYERKAQLNTRMASLFNIDWTNPNAYSYICTNCGHIEWFLPPKT